MGYDFLVVGCGIIGLATAIEVKKAFGGSVCVLDKESQLAAHASGRNSGVLHAGIYYKPGTLKARLCVSGNELMRNFCAEKGLGMVKGKVIVTRDEKEVTTLLELEQRARASGAEVTLIGEEELREIEPYARTVHKALYSPNTVVINPREVLHKMVEDAGALGIIIKTGVALQSLNRNFKEALTSNGRLGYGYLVNAAGAYADRIAQMCGIGLTYTMVPYKGVYLRLKDESNHLVRSNIYPVPDLRFPFLGVHFTRTPQGVVKIGPTAILALSRENYGLIDNIRYQELKESIYCTGKKLFTDKNYLRLAMREVGKYNSYLMYREARRLVPSLKYFQVESYPTVGIRPQLFDKTKNELILDYVLLKNNDSVHILNTISPAFTSSLAFAQHVVTYINGSHFKSYLC
ncbi:MAG: L-2-hydroxyglutarate oxidase [Bacillota bacterium]|jgi:L-2-hydroxyglutarate oxidase LhgO